MKNKKEVAAAYFKAYPKTEKIYVSDDLQVFTSKNLCELHCNTNRIGKQYSYQVFENTTKSSSKKNTKPSVDDRIKAVKELATVADVNKFLKLEKAKAVRKVGLDRIHQLQKADKNGKNGTPPPESRGDKKNKKNK